MLWEECLFVFGKTSSDIMKVQSLRLVVRIPLRTTVALKFNQKQFFHVLVMLKNERDSFSYGITDILLFSYS